MGSSAANNQIISNFIATNYQDGIFVNASSNIINDNTLISNFNNGIILSNASYCFFTNNTIDGHVNGFWITGDSAGNKINHNNISSDVPSSMGFMFSAISGGGDNEIALNNVFDLDLHFHNIISQCSKLIIERLLADSNKRLSVFFYFVLMS